MTLKTFFKGLLCLFSSTFLISCNNNNFGGSNFGSTGPATPEDPYYGSPQNVGASNVITFTIPAKFLYRPLTFTPGSYTGNGLGAVTPANEAAPIPFAEFHIYNSGGARIQQGETNTDGQAIFTIPNTPDTYTLKVFSRSLNNYVKISVLEDIYANKPYSISKSFSLTSADAGLTSKNLSNEPVVAQADESISAKIEGGAFNIMFNILLANEYIRRNTDRNGNTPGVPTSNPLKWWVADKVTVYWKAGFNPYTYFSGSSALSFYTTGERKLYILGGSNGNVRSTDTDHFDDSIILHEYAHFLEDVYANSKSPGGSHTGNFIIDARLAWSEGFANYLQGAILTGANAFGSNPKQPEDRIPDLKKLHHYVDSYGILGSSSAGISIFFNLAGVGTDTSERDNVATDLPGGGTFREVSIARTLYKSTRNTTETYSDSDPLKSGGGVHFREIWKVFSGQSSVTTTSATYSFRNTGTYPIPNAGLFHSLLIQNTSAPTGAWNRILTEEKQNTTTKDYAFYLSNGNSCTYSFPAARLEEYMGANDSVKRSSQHVNNDFYLYYHDGSTASLTLHTTGTYDLDLILYYQDYLYYEDTLWYAGRPSPYVARQSRNVASTTETIELNSNFPIGYYILNVKVNVYNKTNADLTGSSTYTLSKNGATLCGSDR